MSHHRMINTFYRQLDELLDSSSRWRRWLRFPGELEKLFVVDQASVRARENIVASVFACLFFDLFLISDYQLNPANFWHCIVVRIFICTPALVVALWTVHRWKVGYVNDSVCLLITAIAAGCVLLIHLDQSGTMSVISQAGLLVVMSVGTLILRVSLPFVAASNLTLLCGDAVFLYQDRWLNRGEKVTCFLLIGTFAMLSVIARFRTESLERRYFLLYLKEDQRSRMYASLNQNLADLSNRDGLTGLFNRRHLNEHLKKVWELARREAASISIIMVDIDRFKHLNDNQGHLFGDQVLIAMADILQSSIRDEKDSVVRFGGDEFVIILPDTDRVQARETAERICKKVRENEIISPTSRTLVRLTVSCGVASALPVEVRDPLKLLALADQELYRAKELGRNQVCCISDSLAIA